MKRSLFLAMAASAPRAIAGEPPVEAGKAAAVAIRDFAFVPQVLTITAGQAVTWTNQDDDPHAVLSDDKTFRTRALDTGEKATLVFEKPGEYAYFCSLHPHMTARIVVKAP